MRSFAAVNAKCAARASAHPLGSAQCQGTSAAGYYQALCFFGGHKHGPLAKHAEPARLSLCEEEEGGGDVWIVQECRLSSRRHCKPAYLFEHIPSPAKWDVYVFFMESSPDQNMLGQCP